MGTGCTGFPDVQNSTKQGRDVGAAQRFGRKAPLTRGQSDPHNSFRPNDQVKGLVGSQISGHLLMLAEKVFRILSLVTGATVCLDQPDGYLFGNCDLLINCVDANLTIEQNRTHDSK